MKGNGKLRVMERNMRMEEGDIGIGEGGEDGGKVERDRGGCGKDIGENDAGKKADDWDKVEGGEGVYVWEGRYKTRVEKGKAGTQKWKKGVDVPARNEKKYKRA